jgi:N-carbamoyl-L-amino-acid hydrolase
LGAIEVAQSLAEQNITTRHPLEVVIWQNEEGGLWGSHAATAMLTPADLATVSRSGKTIREGIAFLGGDPDHLERTRRAKGSLTAYLELHIEQGGTLEQEKLDIGVVEGIVGIHQWNVTIDGFQNHAGTTAMNNRHDALLSAARFIEAVNRIVTSEPGRQVGTVGRITALPGTVNVIPGKVECTLELRDLDAKKIDGLSTKIQAEAKKIGAMNGTTFTFAQVTDNVPAPTAPAIRAMIAAAATELGLTHKTMPSGAGHDAQDLAQLCPVGMIFVPSIGGISHAPKEYSRPQDITNGANVLLNTLVKLDVAP